MKEFVGDRIKVLSELFRQIQIQFLRFSISSSWAFKDFAEGLHPTKDQHEECPLCKHKFSAPQSPCSYTATCIFGGGLLTRCQCPRCRVIFGPAKMLRMSERRLAREYLAHYSVYSEGDSSELEIRAFNSLHPSKSGVYLNYGSGSWSHTTHILRGDGWQVYSYDPYSLFHDEEEPWHLNRKQVAGMRFDGIFSNNVLEHLRFPIRDLRRLSRSLKPGGLMAHATPCYEYLYEFTRFHLFFYVDGSHKKLWKKAGLICIDEVQDGIFNCKVLIRRHESALKISPN